MDYYKKPQSVVRYDENGNLYLELLPITATPDKNYTDYSGISMIPVDNTPLQKLKFKLEFNKKRAEASKTLFELGTFPASLNPLAGTIIGGVYGGLAAKDAYLNGLNWNNGIQLGLSLPLVGRGLYAGFNKGNNIMQKMLSSNPFPSYKYSDIIKSEFYKSLVENYGENVATRIAKEISTPEGRQFVFGNDPKLAYRVGKKHANQMKFVKEVEDTKKGILGGSGGLARSGTVKRTGLMHDLDFDIEGSMENKTSPVFDELKLFPVFRVSKRFPFVGKTVMGSVKKGYVNVPHINKNLLYADMFIKDKTPTQSELVDLILDAKKLWGRRKDIADIQTFKPYSAENPIINLTTGKGLWNPTLFEKIFTKEGYPTVVNVETYPGSKIKVPSVMNYKGEIRSLNLDNFRLL